MPDISMCSGEGCPFRERCYRATASPSDFRQAYFARPPFVFVLADDTQTSVAKCDYHWPTDSTQALAIQHERASAGSDAFADPARAITVIERLLASGSKP